MNNQKLINKIKKLPCQPGVYIFKDKKKKIIYIGKALSLKTRVQSYFQKGHQNLKTKLLVQQIAELDYQTTRSEFESLLLEAKLIKEHQPKYNLRLKDNKRYLYIAITKKPYRVLSLRRPELAENLLDWFGPFPSSAAVKEVLRLLRRIFPYCSCRKIPKRQCLYFHLKLCPGYQNLSQPEYKKNIQALRRVLKGKTTSLLRILERKMKKAAQNLKFEEAQKYKEQITHLKNLSQGWQPFSTKEWSEEKALLLLRRLLVKYQGISPMTLKKIEGFDIANLGQKIIVGSMVTFLDGQPEKGLYRKFKIKNQKKQNDPASIHQVIKRRLNHPEWLYPQLLLIDGGKPQVSAGFEALREKNLCQQIAILGLAKKEEKIVVPQIKNNQIIKWHLLHYSPRSPVLKLLQQIRDEAHRFAQSYYHLLQKQEINLSSRRNTVV